MTTANKAEHSATAGQESTELSQTLLDGSGNNSRDRSIEFEDKWHWVSTHLDDGNPTY